MAAQLGAQDLKGALLDSLEALRASRGAIDAVNVYPIPDADTGTNLVMTFEAVAAGLEAASDDAAIAEAIAEGALNGARGNSGVILAQILRAWAEGVAGGPMGPPELAAAFDRATTTAYASVLAPAEGTILSVLAAARDAVVVSHQDATGALAAASTAAREALARTTEQMEVLRRAGVVDAGGIGLVLVIDALARRVGVPVEPFEHDAPPDALLCVRQDGPPTFRYEVQYLLTTPEPSIEPLRQLLGTIGDSVAVIGSGERWRVHVHTDEPPRARALGEALGPIAAYEEVDFHQQIAGDVAMRSVPAPAVGARGIPAANHASANLVAVVDGSGAETLFSSIGARVVRGDRDALTAEQLIRAIDDAGPPVIILPNDEEVFARASLLVERYGDKVLVLRTSDQAQGLAVALAYGDARPFEASAADMRASLDRVRSGQVIVAPVAVQTPIGPAAAGRAVAFVEGEAIAIEDDPVLALAHACRVLASGATEMLTILCGSEVGADERARAEQRVRAEVGALALEVHDGGQRRHRYLVAAE